MKRSGKMMLIALVLGFVIGGVAFAENAAQQGAAQQSAAQQMAAQPEKADMAASPQIAPESIELTGTVLSDNTFVDEKGDNYQLIASPASEDLQEHVGEKIKVKATVMESKEGVKNIAVTSYELIKE